MTMKTLNWRAMTPQDLAAVHGIAERIHPDFPERPEVFVERLRLYPAGCRVLASSAPDDPKLYGYLVSHPWHFARPPALDMLLGAIPAPPMHYYIHDIALLPEAQGTGAASQAVAWVTGHAAAAQMRDVSLIAVNGSAGFWERAGFAGVDDPALRDKLASYSADARYMARMLNG